MPKTIYGEEIIKVPRFEEEAGFYTTQKRSKMMARIKGKNTKPEIMLRKAIWHSGYRYRVNDKRFPGKPDILLNKYKLAIFVDGEFWHGFDWSNKKKSIKSNREFWIPKIERNIQRDVENNLKLTWIGFKVMRFWEKEIKNDLDGCLRQVLNYLRVYSHEQE